MNDVFISYAHIDDLPLSDGQKGWISHFHRRLEVRLAQLLGQEARIWRDPKLQGSDMFDETIVHQFRGSKVLISVVTPRYVKSEWCRREFEEFFQLAAAQGGIRVKDKSRIFKVVKTPVPREDLPPRLAEVFSRLLGFDFFDLDPETGRLREYDEAFGPASKQRYFERIYDLAHEICQVLKAYAPEGIEANLLRPFGKTVYLATTTAELQGERDKIRRELVERGHTVVPDAPLPMLSADLKTAVHGYLKESAVAVHLLSQHYGATPEDASESVPALQLQWTAEWADRSKLGRLIWTPAQEVTSDPRQRDFIRRIQEDPALQVGAELFEGNLTLLKKELIRRLAPETKPADPPPASLPLNGPPTVYLICEPQDERAIEPLEDYLFDQGLNVCLPALEGDSAEGNALHRENLLGCDAVLIYFGAAPRAWVDIKLRDLLKAAGYGRVSPLGAQAVYIAPPIDHRKERFRLHNTFVIRQPDEFQPSPDLGAFIQAVKQLRHG